MFYFSAMEMAYAVPNNVIYASDVGLICDGRHDNTNVFEKLFERELREVSIILPPGTCVFSRPLSVTMNRASILGAGGAATILLFDGSDSSSDLILLKNSYGSTLRSFGLWSENKRKNGSAIHIKRSSYITINDMHINNFQTNLNTLWNSIWIDQPNFITINNVYLQSQNDALLLSARGVGTPYQYDVFISNSKLSDSGVGLHIAGGIDNVHIDASEITSNVNNFIDDNSIINAVNQEIYIGSGAVFDQSIKDNFVVNDKFCNRKNYGLISLFGPITNSKNGSGIIVKSFNNCELSINSPLIAKNKLDGVDILDKSAFVSISPSVFVSDNGRYGVYSKYSSMRYHINPVFVENKKADRAGWTDTQSPGQF